MTETTAKKETQPKPHYLGHRERLRQRFLKDNGKNMADYELLELLLTFAIPRRDVKEQAKSLIKEFGSYAGVINASQTKLESFGLSQTTITILKLVAESVVKVAWQKLRESDVPVLNNLDYIIDYCRSAMAYQEVEEFRVIFLNAQGLIIKEQTMQRGTVNHVAVHEREIAKEALNCGALSVILIHNHPGGRPQPSEADLRQTNKVSVALNSLGIRVLDHLIITKDNYYSFRSCGKIKDMI